jgi:hypothetical protein
MKSGQDKSKSDHFATVASTWLGGWGSVALRPPDAQHSLGSLEIHFRLLRSFGRRTHQNISTKYYFYDFNNALDLEDV